MGIDELVQCVLHLFITRLEFRNFLLRLLLQSLKIGISLEGCGDSLRDRIKHLAPEETLPRALHEFSERFG